MTVYQCSKCHEDIPSMGLAPAFPYCARCRSCTECGSLLTVAEIAHAEEYSTWICDKCQIPEKVDRLVVQQIPFSQTDLNWINRMRMMLEPNLSLSPESNINHAELAAESSLSIISGKYINPDDAVEEIYIRLKRLEAIVAVYSVAIKHRRAEIKSKITKQEKQKYESAMTQSKQDAKQQCPKCKTRFLEAEIAEHTAKCQANLTPAVKTKIKNSNKLIQGFMDSLGMSETEAIEYANEIMAKKAAKQLLVSPTTSTEEEK